MEFQTEPQLGEGNRKTVLRLCKAIAAVEVPEKGVVGSTRPLLSSAIDGDQVGSMLQKKWQMPELESSSFDTEQLRQHLGIFSGMWELCDESYSR